MTSPDGITWTFRTSAADNIWISVCWAKEAGTGLFVAVALSGTGNRVMTSPDGITWTLRTSAADNTWYSVCWAKEVGTGLFVAVATSGTGNRVMTSPDGITWTLRTSAADNLWYSVCWSAEVALFVAVGASGTGNRVMTSPDGINWTSRTCPDKSWSSVCWAKEIGLFVAVASGTGDRVMTSPDGINWTSRTSAANNNWVSVCWSPELFMFVGVSANGYVCTQPLNNMITGNLIATSFIKYGGSANDFLKGDGTTDSNTYGQFITPASVSATFRGNTTGGTPGTVNIGIRRSTNGTDSIITLLIPGFTVTTGGTAPTLIKSDSAVLSIGYMPPNNIYTTAVLLGEPCCVHILSTGFINFSLFSGPFPAGTSCGLSPTCVTYAI
jgi:hypothetical protein